MRPPVGDSASGMPAAAIVLVTVASALLIAPAPTYDPWMWLLWGRETASLSLSTVEGPAFKPLPVAVCAVLSLLGPAAPVAWVLIARAGAVVAVFVAYRAVGALAAAAVALTGAFVAYAAAGAETGWTTAFALLRRCSPGATTGRARRSGSGSACALLRVEAWPFLLVAGVVAVAPSSRVARPDGAVRGRCAGAVAGARVAGLRGSHALGRARPRVRTPASPPPQPCRRSRRCARRPRSRSGRSGSARASRRARLRPVLFAGLAWIALVALMAQAGFSGEPRYSLPGGACVAVAGAAGAARARPAAGGLRGAHHRGAARRRRAQARRPAGCAARTGLPAGARRGPAPRDHGRRRPDRALAVRAPVRRPLPRPPARLPARRRKAPRRLRAEPARSRLPLAAAHRRGRSSRPLRDSGRAHGSATGPCRSGAPNISPRECVGCSLLGRRRGRGPWRSPALAIGADGDAPRLDRAPHAGPRVRRRASLRPRAPRDRLQPAHLGRQRARRSRRAVGPRAAGTPRPPARGAAEDRTRHQ